MGTRNGEGSQDVRAEFLEPGVDAEGICHGRIVHDLGQLCKSFAYYMAMTARAADHAVSELKEREYLRMNTYDAIVIGSGISGGWPRRN